MYRKPNEVERSLEVDKKREKVLKKIKSIIENNNQDQHKQNKSKKGSTGKSKGNKNSKPETFSKKLENASKVKKSVINTFMKYIRK